jgi:predicted RNase H-like nuclease (RuvC/YqgF family)
MAPFSELQVERVKGQYLREKLRQALGEMDELAELKSQEVDDKENELISKHEQLTDSLAVIENQKIKIQGLEERLNHCNESASMLWERLEKIRKIVI